MSSVWEGLKVNATRRAGACPAEAQTVQTQREILAKVEIGFRRKSSTRHKPLIPSFLIFRQKHSQKAWHRYRFSISSRTSQKTNHGARQPPTKPPSTACHM